MTVFECRVLDIIYGIIAFGNNENLSLQQVVSLLLPIDSHKPPNHSSRPQAINMNKCGLLLFFWQATSAEN